MGPWGVGGVNAFRGTLAVESRSLCTDLVWGPFCKKIKKKLESNGWFWQLLTYSFLRFHLGKKKMAPNPLTVASPPGRRLS